MAVVNHEPKKLVLAWFVISSFVVLWDTGYILSRPHSFAGGKWHWIWKPYALYGDIDYIYSKTQYELKNGFTAAQGAMNIVETLLNFLYVYMAAIDGRPRLRALAPLVGLSVAIMTFWKTALYWLQDYLTGPKGWGFTGHNKVYEFWVLFAIPNGFWLVVPAILSVYFYREISSRLLTAAGLGPEPVGPAAGTRSRARKSVKSQ
ncbi:hypothetical protein CBS101457_004481 [Exobasidium rhododendri]|nr:hypothetical protein CBS101457_004481 [Exobasidium rhododendri]